MELGGLLRMATESLLVVMYYLWIVIFSIFCRN